MSIEQQAFVGSRRCVCCGETKHVSEFKKLRGEETLDLYCKLCRRRIVVAAAWRKKNGRAMFTGGTYQTSNDNLAHSGMKYCILSGIARPIDEFPDGVLIHPTCKDKFMPREDPVTRGPNKHTLLLERLHRLERKVSAIESVLTNYPNQSVLLQQERP